MYCSYWCLVYWWFNNIHPVDEEVQEKKVDGDGENESPKHSDKKGKSFPKPASSSASTNLDKKTQQMVAELKRLKSQMVEFKQSVHRPPVYVEWICLLKNTPLGTLGQSKMTKCTAAQI